MKKLPKLLELLFGKQITEAERKEKVDLRKKRPRLGDRSGLLGFMKESLEQSRQWGL